MDLASSPGSLETTRHMLVEPVEGGGQLYGVPRQMVRFQAQRYAFDDLRKEEQLPDQRHLRLVGE